MSSISRFGRDQVTPCLATLFVKVLAQHGNVPNMLRVMAHRPEIFSTLLSGLRAPASLLPRRLCCVWLHCYT
jgi:hypothetical protein